MKIPFNKPFIIGNELKYIEQAVLENSRTAGDGPFTKKCQAWFEANLKCKKALLTNSCTAALEMSAILIGIRPGDEVIMPSYTFVSTANAIVMRGGVPVFIDIRPDTLNMDESLIEEAITPQTKAILPVHYAGNPCEMNQILALAKKHGLHVIEDAAQALLSTYKGKPAGTIGQLGCLSFHETKNVISGEGGALLINDDHYTEAAEIVWEKGTNRRKFFRGQVDKYTWVDLGSSFLPSELVAAFLFAQLEHAQAIIERRLELFKNYYENLQCLEDKGLVRLPIVAPDGKLNGHIFYLITQNMDERTRLIDHLKCQDIQAVFHYVPLHSAPAGQQFGRTSGRLRQTEEIAGRLLRLPLYYELSEADQRRVIDAVLDFYRCLGHEER